MEPDRAPWWVTALVASVIPLCAAGYALVKFLRTAKGAVREEVSADKTEQLKINSAEKAEEMRLRNEERRSAADEAWMVVDRLKADLEAQAKKIEAIELKCDEAIEASRRKEQAAQERATRCETEHSATRAVLRVIFAWAKSKRMPIPEGIEAQINDANAPPHLQGDRANG